MFQFANVNWKRSKIIIFLNLLKSFDSSWKHIHLLVCSSHYTNFLLIHWFPDNLVNIFLTLWKRSLKEITIFATPIPKIFFLFKKYSYTISILNSLFLYLIDKMKIILLFKSSLAAMRTIQEIIFSIGVIAEIKTQILQSKIQWTYLQSWKRFLQFPFYIQIPKNVLSISNEYQYEQSQYVHYWNSSDISYTIF